ncbi:MAG: serine/threonine-protein phosphatase [Leptospiraceae bacterium]|nr:serine/threonine-protein phosphatase [Leptospiraceae bacterium]
MKVNCAYLTHKGNVRENNEDSMLVQDVIYSNQSFTNAISIEIEDESHLVFAVADGMGGHARGEVASHAVLEFIHNNFSSFTSEEGIRKTIDDAKFHLDDLVRKDNNAYGLGTTLCGIVIKGNTGLLFNAGDSRLYKRKDGFLEKLTRDHSFVQYLVDNGIITEEEMSFHPKKNIVTSAVSGDLMKESPEMFFKEITIEEGDQFLICTDGVWESLSLEELEVCMLDAELIKKTDVLTENILRYGGLDNLSIIMLEVLNLQS